MNDFKAFHLPGGANIITDGVPGKRSRELLEFQKKYEGNIVTYPVKMPMALKRAKGAVLEDVDGNRFIDFFSGCGVLNVGHSNEEVLQYVRAQQDNLVHALDFPTENKMNVIQNILSQLPEDVRDEYKVSFCAPTGSDVIEAAIKLAKHKTGRSSILAFHGSYHGMTSGALAVTSDTGFRRKLESLIPNVHFIPYSYCYRCPFGKQAGSCRMDCAEYLRYVLENPHSGMQKPAAILIEPIQGEGGNIVPAEGYLERIVDIAHNHGIVVIFDEVQSGFFRTGRFLASQSTQALPDIYTMSKGLGGIGFPISAIVYRRSIEAWGTGDHIGTFRGNQVSLAAANGAFRFIADHEVSAHVDAISAYLCDRLSAIAEESAHIGEVRGKGLMIGIEYVHDKHTREPFPQFVSELRKECFQRGLLFEVGGHYNNVIRFVPPLIINKALVDEAISILSAASTVVEGRLAETIALA